MARSCETSHRDPRNLLPISSELPSRVVTLTVHRQTGLSPQGPHLAFCSRAYFLTNPVAPPPPAIASLVRLCNCVLWRGSVASRSMKPPGPASLLSIVPEGRPRAFLVGPSAQARAG